jgi:DNA invertase Pin-like site-specific DNA recombinase
MRVALYARCSTAEQTVNLQLDGVREYAGSRGFQVVDEYIDEAVSGAKTKRPALDRLFEDAHRRRFDAVVVWKLDRLGRSLSHLIRVVDTLGSLGIDLVSLSDPGLDTTVPSGRLIFHVMGAVAEFERDLIRGRVRAGMQAAKKRGRRIGRPKRILSRTDVLALREQGLSNTEIARRLSVSRPTLIRELRALGL